MFYSYWICGNFMVVFYSEERVERLVLLCNYVGLKLVMFEMLCVWVLRKGGKWYYNVLNGNGNFWILL